MGKIFLVGDTHGISDIEKIKNFKQAKELTKDDYLIILGDAGIIWGGTDEGLEYGYKAPNGCIMNTQNDKKLIEFYDSQPYTTLFLDGNHENHKCLNSYPVSVWNGGKVHKISDSIIHLMRGEVYTINTLKFFVMGGADSIDKGMRIQDLSWWSEELPSNDEIDNAIVNINKHCGVFDYILTHCAGTNINSQLCRFGTETNALTIFFDFIEDKIEYDKWYFGHYHKDKAVDNKHICVWNKIIEL